MIEYPLDLPLRIEFPVRKMFYSRKACITFRRQERKVNTGQIRKPDYITIRCFVIAWRIIIYTEFYGVPFVYNIPYCGDLQISTSMNMIFLKNCFNLLLQFTSINFSSNQSEFFNNPGWLEGFYFCKSFCPSCYGCKKAKIMPTVNSINSYNLSAFKF